MRSKIIAAVALVLGTFIAVPAFADQGKPVFPMPAAQFQQRVDARQTKARTHMEERASKLSPADAQALRARFEDRIAKVNVEVAKVVADGTVTKEEAKEVRAMSPHHHHGNPEKKS